jgi:hypothetical protein
VVPVIFDVTAITIPGGPLKYSRAVTGSASHSGVFPSQMIAAGLMFKKNRLPVLRSMASGAILTQGALVRVFLLMTTVTIDRGPFEYSTGMTGRAIHPCMFTNQRIG